MLACDWEQSTVKGRTGGALDQTPSAVKEDIASMRTDSQQDARKLVNKGCRGQELTLHSRIVQHIVTWTRTLWHVLRIFECDQSEVAGPTQAVAVSFSTLGCGFLLQHLEPSTPAQATWAAEISLIQCRDCVLNRAGMRF